MCATTGVPIVQWQTTLMTSVSERGGQDEEETGVTSDRKYTYMAPLPRPRGVRILGFVLDRDRVHQSSFPDVTSTYNSAYSPRALSTQPTVLSPDNSDNPRAGQHLKRPNPFGKMLNLAWRILAILACLYGIAECARISKEVMEDHVDPTICLESQSKASFDQKRPWQAIILGKWHHTHKDAGEGPLAVMAELVTTITKVLDTITKRQFLKSGSAHRLKKYSHWTASRTQIHPAIA
ncbi:hypothetical protein ABEF95_010319 [Exophiala dermatitidis]